MVVLAVLLYCLVPSGCPIGHIVYLWTLTVEITALLVRLPGLEPGASGLGVDPIRHREVASNA